MRREIILTEDGSHTVVAPGKLAYHSRHGAIQESAHVYVRSGFDFVTSTKSGGSVRIFEMGLGTGLNVLLTLRKALETGITVDYITIDTEPMDPSEIRLLNFCEQLEAPALQPAFELIHDCAWDQYAFINPNFRLKKVQQGLQDFEIDSPVDLIYYDAFSPQAQPELWTTETFTKLLTFLVPGGALVTYCSKGDVKRAMKAAGFRIKKVPGPLYKRDIIRAIRPVDQSIE